MESADGELNQHSKHFLQITSNVKNKNFEAKLVHAALILNG